jgi:hypothetical protein
VIIRSQALKCPASHAPSSRLFPPALIISPATRLPTAHTHSRSRRQLRPRPSELQSDERADDRSRPGDPTRSSRTQHLSAKLTTRMSSLFKGQSAMMFMRSVTGVSFNPQSVNFFATSYGFVPVTFLARRSDRCVFRDSLAEGHNVVRECSDLQWNAGRATQERSNFCQVVPHTENEASTRRCRDLRGVAREPS